jgi:hypothetical protein
MQQDHLPTRFCCKAPSAWDYPRPASVARALRAALEPWDLADSFPMPLGLRYPADLVEPAVGELAGLVRCKEPAELSFLVVDRVAGLEAVLAEEEEAASDYFAKPSIASALAFTTATKIRHSTQSHIR